MSALELVDHAMQRTGEFAPGRCRAGVTRWALPGLDDVLVEAQSACISGNHDRKRSEVADAQVRDGLAGGLCSSRRDFLRLLLLLCRLKRYVPEGGGATGRFSCRFPNSCSWAADVDPPISGAFGAAIFWARIAEGWTAGARCTTEPFVTKVSMVSVMGTEGLAACVALAATSSAAVTHPATAIMPACLRVSLPTRKVGPGAGVESGSIVLALKCAS